MPSLSVDECKHEAVLWHARCQLVAPRLLIRTNRPPPFTENILGPLFVYMSPQFREVPSIWTLVGGGILLVTLAVHEVVLWHLRAGSSTRPRRYCPSASSCETGSSGKSGNKLDRAMYRVGTGRLFARIRSTAPGSESTRSLEAVISAPTGEVDVEGAPQRERC